LIVSFGPTLNVAVPSNVERCVNYYTGDFAIRRGSGFKGTLTNVDFTSDPDINHLNIEKVESLHRIVIAKIQAILPRDRAGGPAPVH
jgi:hypothetical protein